MMTTSRPERFVILSLGKTMPSILLPTTVCHQDDDDVDSDDDDSGDSDDFEIARFWRYWYSTIIVICNHMTMILVLTSTFLTFPLLSGMYELHWKDALMVFGKSGRYIFAAGIYIRSSSLNFCISSSCRLGNRFDQSTWMLRQLAQPLSTLFFNQSFVTKH